MELVSKKYYYDIDLRGNRLLNFAVESASGELPSEAKEGAVIYHSGEGVMYQRLKDGWKVIASGKDLEDALSKVSESLQVLSKDTGEALDSKADKTTVASLRMEFDEEVRIRAEEDTNIKADLDTKADKTTVSSLSYTLTEEIQDRVAGDSTNATAISTHTTDRSNPHEVTKSQIGLGNVDDTSDIDKPISTATQNALDAKADKTAMETALGTKQDTLVAGSHISIASDGKTISSTYDVASTTANGLMSKDDKSKLDEISAGAQVNVIETVRVNNTALGVSGKAVNIDLSDYATKTDVNNAISSAIEWKGTVEKVSELSTINASKGDLYHVNEKSAEFVYNGTAWEELGSIVDLSDYVTTSAMTTALGGKQDTLTAGANITISGATISAKDTTYGAGTGISLNGTTINHSNSVSANTTGVGSATAVPVIKYDGQGHITSISTATIYPPTSAGTSGQYWKSDGSGAGVWQSLDTSPTASSTNAITSGAVKSALDGKLATNGTAAKATADASGNNIVNTYAKKTEIPDVSGFETKANAITGLSVSGRTITYTKGDGSTGTITTQDNNSDTKVRQTLQTGNHNLPLLMSYQTNTNTTANVDNVCYRNNNIYANPSTGTISATILDGKIREDREDISGQTINLDDLNLSSGNPHIIRYIEKTSGGSSNITNIPVTGLAFILDVELIRHASTTDYITMQRFISVGAQSNEYVRYCTSGTWGSWTKRVFTDTTYSVATQSANGLLSSTDKKKLDSTVWMTLADLGSNYTMTASDFNQAYPCRRKVNTFASNELSPDGANIGDYYLYSLGHTDTKGYSTILAVTPRLNGANEGTNLYIGHFWSGTWKGWSLVNAVSGVKGNSESTYRTGNVNITKANIGLGNVDNTSDANKPISTATQNALNGKQATMSAGTGIALDGATINHSNSVTAKTSYVGSATAVPRIQYDAQGHITASTTATIYPPTTVGTAGQIWQSDGSGAGTWQTLDTTPTASSTKAVTSGGVKTALDAKAGTSVATTSANGLMSSTDKSKLDGIATGANKTTVDSSLSSSSTNPVQNKVINTALAGKANSSHTHTEYLPLAGGKVTGPTSFTGTVGNTQSEAGVYLGLDTNASAPNANIAIVSANTASYIDMGAPNEDYGFRIIKWKGMSDDLAQLCYSDANITIPRANGTMALRSDIPTYSSGTGISVSGTTINHSNSVTAQTSYVGSATAVPRIQYDAQGHITACTTATIYAPTTAGSAGQIWVSDGSGAGTWKHKITMSTSDPSGGANGDIWFKYE